jgi:predicted transposase YdaD
MKESKFYQEILEEGRTAGLLEGRAAGLLEGSRAAIHQALELRFGAEAAAPLMEALRGIGDPQRLTELHRLAIQCRRLSEFRRALAAGHPPR